MLAGFFLVAVRTASSSLPESVDRSGEHDFQAGRERTLSGAKTKDPLPSFSEEDFASPALETRMWAAARYFVQAQKDNGLFVYNLEGKTGEDVPDSGGKKNNEVRQAGASWALAYLLRLALDTVSGQDSHPAAADASGTGIRTNRPAPLNLLTDLLRSSYLNLNYWLSAGVVLEVGGQDRPGSCTAVPFAEDFTANLVWVLPRNHLTAPFPRITANLGVAALTVLTFLESLRAYRILTKVAATDSDAEAAEQGDHTDEPLVFLARFFRDLDQKPSASGPSLGRNGPSLGTNGPIVAKLEKQVACQLFFLRSLLKHGGVPPKIQLGHNREKVDTEEYFRFVSWENDIQNRSGFFDGESLLALTTALDYGFLPSASQGIAESSSEIQFFKEASEEASARYCSGSEKCGNWFHWGALAMERLLNFLRRRLLTSSTSTEKKWVPQIQKILFEIGRRHIGTRDEKRVVCPSYAACEGVVAIAESVRPISDGETSKEKAERALDQAANKVTTFADAAHFGDAKNGFLLNVDAAEDGNAAARAAKGSIPIFPDLVVQGLKETLWKQDFATQAAEVEGGKEKVATGKVPLWHGGVRSWNGGGGAGDPAVVGGTYRIDDVQHFVHAIGMFFEQHHQKLQGAVPATGWNSHLGQGGSSRRSTRKNLLRKHQPRHAQTSEEGEAEIEEKQRLRREFSPTSREGEAELEEGVLSTKNLLRKNRVRRSEASTQKTEISPSVERKNEAVGVAHAGVDAEDVNFTSSAPARVILPLVVGALCVGFCVHFAWTRGRGRELVERVDK